MKKSLFFSLIFSLLAQLVFAGSQTYVLQKGWNLVGVFLNLYDASEETLLSYQPYEFKEQGGVTLYQPAEEIVAGRAYWINWSNASKTLVLAGDSADEACSSTAGAAGDYRLTGAQSVAVGESVTCTAPVVSGYTFTEWTASGVTLSSKTAKTVTFTMPANSVKLTPNYRKSGSGSGATSVGSCALRCHTYSLHKGWNLIGISLDPTEASAAELFASQLCNYKRQGNSGSYCKTDEIMAGKAYWIYRNKATELRVEGYAVENFFPGGDDAGLSDAARLTETLSVAKGCSVTRTAPIVKGYAFTKWTYSGISNADATANPLVFTMPANPVKLTPNYRKLSSYTLIVNGKSSSQMECDPVTVTASDKTGYVFTDWTVSGVTLKDTSAKTVSFAMPANNVTLTANYTNKFMLTVDGKTSQRTYGDKISETAPAKTGYDFTGWTVSGVTVKDKTANPITFTMPASDVTLTSNYTATKYTLTVNGTSSQVAYGSTVTETAPGKTGYVFTDWTVSGVTVKDKAAETISFTMPANNVTLTANYAAKKFNLTVDGKKSQKSYGESVSVTAAAKTGCDFDYWTVEGVSVSSKTANPITITMPANDVTLTSNYTATKYTLSVNGSTSQVACGSTVTQEAPAKSGYEFTNWTVSGVTVKDKTANPISFTMPANNVTLTANYEKVGDRTYLVVDLTTGKKRYTDTAPNLSSDTCRTTELWLRKIPAGNFILGSPKSEVGRRSTEERYEVTLTKDFYIGIFEMTQKQYVLIKGDNPSDFLGDTRPVETVSYNTIRGRIKGSQWPYSSEVDDSSFLGLLRKKTGLAFDLPTVAQWEYACRAGTKTALNTGKNLSSEQSDAAMDEAGRYKYNCSDGKGGYSQHTKVGSYRANNWGLYDMHGNVFEWCLDWDWKGEAPNNNGTDPVGPCSGCQRETRSGSWYSTAASCRSAKRGDDSPDTVGDGDGGGDYGFRVVYVP